MCVTVWPDMAVFGTVCVLIAAEKVHRVAAALGTPSPDRPVTITVCTTLGLPTRPTP
ncbi:hypothetical protein ACWGE1_21690 [Streptomyces sp. NPDC054932]